METSAEENHSTDASTGGNLASDKSDQIESMKSCEPNTTSVESADMVVDEPSASGVTESHINSSLKINMLARVAVSDAHFKHQQRGEPDLTLEDKIQIAQSVFDKSKAGFLSRFWSYLELEDIEVFQDSLDQYEVGFYVQQIMRSKNKVFQQNRVKNRRYEAMKELISEGEYFSEEEMKYREPYLYDQLIGQYLTQEEVQAKVDKSDLTFSNILLKHIDQLDENVRFGYAKDVEEGQMEESEEDDEEEEDDGQKGNTFGCDQKDEDKPKISDEKKQELKAEFLTIMQQKFLQGDDKNFDYSKVDNNDAYDDLAVLNADAEEKYFDDEDPESIHSDSNL